MQDNTPDLDDDTTDGVSWRPSAMVPDSTPEPPSLADIRLYRPTGDYDKNRLNPTVPRFVYRGLKSLNDRAGRTSVTRVAIWGMARGLRRLQRDIPEIDIICDAHSAALQAGDEHAIVQLETWAYAIPPLYGVNKKMNLRSVPPFVQGQCADIAERLGLAMCTFVSLAIMSGIVDCELPADLSEPLESQLREFRLAVRQRARLAQDLAHRATAVTAAPLRRGTWLVDE